ncbi:MAG TPA: hydrolase [Actinobacteria bacterium]|nr:hydrolase [Actinomycetota bacterium]
MSTAPACLPPPGLPGLDPRWSVVVEARDADGVSRSWHVLDTHADGPEEDIRLTVLCVHGNPTWSYLWRSVLASAPADVRVIAVDHLDMGFSDRTGTVRPLAQRVADLGSLTSALGVVGPVVVVAHDWGGPISLGWVLEHQDEVAGVALLNTAVHQPDASRAPSVIRVARATPVRHAATVLTPAFIRGTTALSGRRLPPDVAAAYSAPYRSADARAAIGDFVADIPLEDDHVSAGTLEAIAEGIRALTMPVLLLWGPGDPVFSDRYLHDLEERLPQADVHRYEGARHLVIEDAPALVADLWTWISDLRAGGAEQAADDRAGSAQVDRPMWAALAERAAADPDGLALAEPRDGSWRRIPWALLDANVARLASGLAAEGVRPGDRVSVLIPVGADLIAVIYACWRLGASVVVTDAGLGPRGMVRALRSAAPDHIVAVPKGLALVRLAALPGRRIPVSRLVEIARAGAALPLPAGPGLDDEALVAFTSGSTGPAKGVVYAHRQLQATRDLLQEHYGLTPDDALVAAFAPWAVLGPALGIPSAIPDMDVTAPRTLTARAVADATRQVRGTLMWASPAALTGVLKTASALTDDDLAALQSLRYVLGAGAPVSAAILHGIQRLVPGASVRTPYGMTEVLPVCDVVIDDIDAAGPGPGVLVGNPLPGVEVRISEVDGEGRARGLLSDAPGVLGEVAVRAPHRKVRYDRLWATERASSRDAGWHRTGDVGSLDERGRLWIAGRLAHVITTVDGPIGPVPVEQAVERIPGVDRAACVGVGPTGAQLVVVVCVTGGREEGVANLALTDDVRAVTGLDVAAVLLRRDLPVDIRHQSKIDRRAVAEWADRLLAGRR